MRKLFIASAAVAALFFSNTSSAQSLASCPKAYVGFSAGLENPSGLLGFNIDVPVISSLSIGGGAGLSSWGYKVNGEAKFYFAPCNSGWAVGAGVTHNTGLKDMTTKLETTMGEQEVLVDLKPVTNVFFSAYRFWSVGKRGNRIHLQTGYSVRLTDDYYVVKSGEVLTSDSKTALQILAPGGFMLGAGFSFALGN